VRDPRVEGEVQVGLYRRGGEQVREAAHDGRVGLHIVRRGVADAVALGQQNEEARLE